jgi:hypothetical protein
VFTPDSTYLLTFAANTTVTDLAGGPLTFPSDFALCFDTGDAPSM